MAKLGILFTVTLLLCFLLSHAARHEPALKAQLQNVKGEEAEVEESCEGAGKEECLIKRSLAAHLDYIYTQKKP